MPTGHDKTSLMFILANEVGALQKAIAALSGAGFGARSARLWTLTGPALHATNEEDPMTCTVTEHSVPSVAAPLRLTFPARSMTAVEVRR